MQLKKVDKLIFVRLFVQKYNQNIMIHYFHTANSIFKYSSIDEIIHRVQWTKVGSLELWSFNDHDLTLSVRMETVK